MRLGTNTDGEFPEQETATLANVENENRTFDMQLVARRQQLIPSN
jgi:hypothetical protein